MVPPDFCTMYQGLGTEEKKRKEKKRKEKKRNSSMPSLMTGLHTIQPCAICAPTKSPGAGWLGTIVEKVQVRRWKRESKWFGGLEDPQWQIQKDEGWKEWADVKCQLATQVQQGCWAWSMTKD